MRQKMNEIEQLQEQIQKIVGKRRKVYCEDPHFSNDTMEDSETDYLVCRICGKSQKKVKQKTIMGLSEDVEKLYNYIFLLQNDIEDQKRAKESKRSCKEKEQPKKLTEEEYRRVLSRCWGKIYNVLEFKEAEPCISYGSLSIETEAVAGWLWYANIEEDEDVLEVKHQMQSLLVGGLDLK